jgi:RNA polymerase sigma factor (sigma-70 family)
MMNRIKEVESIQTPTRLADGDLLARFLKRRDDSAFAELVARHGRMVFGVCLRRLGQTADAEDAFQAVFLTLAKHAEELASRTTVGPWLYTVVRQVTTKALRSRRRRRWLPWTSAPEPQAAVTTEVDVDLDAALATLNEQERSAIVLCHLEGLSRTEAAKALGCPEGTLSARLSRGLDKLRKKLGKPPLAVLVAASLVMLPDELPASTVDLVHHFRNGALDDWASPGTLDLYRKADPMRYLHRAGPIVAAFAAVGLIMVGVSFGWNLIQAQQDEPKKEKKAAGEPGRGSNPFGGDGVDPVGPAAESADDTNPFGQGGDRSGGLRSRSGNNLEPGMMGQGLSGGGGRGGSGDGRRGFSGFGTLGGGRGGMEGGMGGGTERRPSGNSGVWLADAVKDFNQWAQNTSIGPKQSPLTEDEVIAAIVAWTREPGAPASGELFNAFQQVAETRKMPKAWSLDAVDSWKFNNREFEGWRIHLRLSLAPNNSYTHVIRDQKFRVRQPRRTDNAVKATDSALITIPLKNSNADSIAEVLSKAIDGKWLETKVTADSRTNSLIILAPKSKEESIRKTVQALDDLQK